MAATRNGRAQQRPDQPPVTEYTLLVGGLVSCRRCACLLPDTRPAREQHTAHHASLRKMWDALGGQS
jgi:hypothetical protein